MNPALITQVEAVPDELMRTMRAFQESRVLLTALELDVFTALGSGATAPDVAKRLKTDPRATEMLLNALVSMELLSKSGGRFSNTPDTAKFFAAGSPHNARLAMMHTVHLWDTWSTLTDCVRAGTSVTRLEEPTHGDDWTEAFIAAMHYLAPGTAPSVIEAVGLQGVRRMLDLGGGSGAYSIAFAQASPQLQIEILDLPDVLPLTERYVRQAGLSDRIKLRPGDLLHDIFSTGFDLVLLSAICHSFSPEQNCDLFRRACQALVPGGRIVVREFILDPDRTSPRWAALFSLNMLVGTESGASYSEADYAAWLREAGFTDVHRVNLPGPSGLMIGKRE